MNNEKCCTKTKTVKSPAFSDIKISHLNSNCFIYSFMTTMFPCKKKRKKKGTKAEIQVFNKKLQ